MFPGSLIIYSKHLRAINSNAFTNNMGCCHKYQFCKSLLQYILSKKSRGKIILIVIVQNSLIYMRDIFYVTHWKKLNQSCRTEKNLNP